MVKLGSKARTELKEPFLNLAKEFRKVKDDNVDPDGNIGNMEFEEGDVFGMILLQAQILCTFVKFYSEKVLICKNQIYWK